MSLQSNFKLITETLNKVWDFCGKPISAIAERFHKNVIQLNAQVIITIYYKRVPIV